MKTLDELTERINNYMYLVVEEKKLIRKNIPDLFMAFLILSTLLYFLTLRLLSEEKSLFWTILMMLPVLILAIRSLVSALQRLSGGFQQKKAIQKVFLEHYNSNVPLHILNDFSLQLMKRIEEKLGIKTENYCHEAIAISFNDFEFRASYYPLERIHKGLFNLRNSSVHEDEYKELAEEFSRYEKLLHTLPDYLPKDSPLTSTTLTTIVSAQLNLLEVIDEEVSSNFSKDFIVLKFNTYHHSDDHDVLISRFMALLKHVPENNEKEKNLLARRKMIEERTINNLIGTKAISFMVNLEVIKNNYEVIKTHCKKLEKNTSVSLKYEAYISSMEMFGVHKKSFTKDTNSIVFTDGAVLSSYCTNYFSLVLQQLLKN